MHHLHLRFLTIEKVNNYAAIWIEGIRQVLNTQAIFILAFEVTKAREHVKYNIVLVFEWISHVAHEEAQLFIFKLSSVADTFCRQINSRSQP